MEVDFQGGREVAEDKDWEGCRLRIAEFYGPLR